jgi:hypothetical protein
MICFLSFDQCEEIPKPIKLITLRLSISLFIGVCLRLRKCFVVSIVVFPLSAQDILSVGALFCHVFNLQACYGKDHCQRCQQRKNNQWLAWKPELLVEEILSHDSTRKYQQNRQFATISRAINGLPRGNIKILKARRVCQGQRRHETFLRCQGHCLL